MEKESNYKITQNGYNVVNRKLENALEELQKAKMLLKEAAESSDSWHDNFSFEEGQKRFAYWTQRVAFYKQQLLSVSVIELTKNEQLDIVIWGSKVTLEEVDEKEIYDVIILGENEVDTKKGIISEKSALGTALMGKQRGDSVYVECKESYSVVILDIQPFDDSELSL